MQAKDNERPWRNYPKNSKEYLIGWYLSLKQRYQANYLALYNHRREKHLRLDHNGHEKLVLSTGCHTCNGLEGIIIVTEHDYLELADKLRQLGLTEEQITQLNEAAADFVPAEYDPQQYLR